MIFDLSDPRRKGVVRVVYGVLAVLFAGGFILFGIGSESGAGGLFDGLFGQGGGSGSTADQYAQQIEDAEERLEADPDNPAALTTLARYRYLSGTAQLDQDETTGAPVVTEEARSEFEAAIEAWNRYLETKPRQPDVATAGNIVQAYALLNDASGAAETQEILAESNPSPGAYSQLALYRYFDFDFKGGDQAAERAVAEAKNPAEAKQVQRQLDQMRQAALAEQRRVERAGEEGGAAAGEALENPLGGFGGGAPTPTAP